MSEHSRVHFADNGSYEGLEDLRQQPRDESRRRLRRSSHSRSEERGRPKLRQGRSRSRSSVRFNTGPTVASPRISSPVIRDPTPYRAPQPFVDIDEDEVQHPKDMYQSIPPNLDPSITSIPALGDPPHWRGRPSPTDHDMQEYMDHHAIPYQQQQFHTSPRHLSEEISSGDDTIYDENDRKRDIDDLKAPSVPPLAYLRQGDETIRPVAPLRPALKQTATGLEEGGVPARRGIMANLMSLYGISRRKADYDDLTLSRATTTEAAATLRNYRMNSTYSETGQSDPKPLDPDHPSVTGVKKNTKGFQPGDKTKHHGRRITDHVACKNTLLFAHE